MTTLREFQDPVPPNRGRAPAPKSKAWDIFWTIATLILFALGVVGLIHYAVERWNSHQ